MEFTQAEAKEKENKRQWVRVREEWNEETGMLRGTRGYVIGADALKRGDGATDPAFSVVHVCFPAEGVLIFDIRKDRYLEAFEEVAGEGQSAPAPVLSPDGTKKGAPVWLNFARIGGSGSLGRKYSIPQLFSVRPVRAFSLLLVLAFLVSQLEGCSTSLA